MTSSLCSYSDQARAAAQYVAMGQFRHAGVINFGLRHSIFTMLEMLGREESLKLREHSAQPGAFTWLPSYLAYAASTPKSSAHEPYWWSLPKANEVLERVGLSRAKTVFDALLSEPGSAARVFAAHATRGDAWETLQGTEEAIKARLLQTAPSFGDAVVPHMLARGWAVELTRSAAEQLAPHLAALANALGPIPEFHSRDLLGLAQRFPPEQLAQVGHVLRNGKPGVASYVMSTPFLQLLDGLPLQERLAALEEELAALNRMGPINEPLDWGSKSVFLPQGAGLQNAKQITGGSNLKVWRVGDLVIKFFGRFSRYQFPPRELAGAEERREFIRMSRAAAAKTVHLLDELRTKEPFASKFGHTIPQTRMTPAGALVQRVALGVTWHYLPIEVRDKASLQQNEAIEAARKTLDVSDKSFFIDERNRDNFLFDPTTGDLVAWFDPVAFNKIDPLDRSPSKLPKDPAPND